MNSNWKWLRWQKGRQGSGYSKMLLGTLMWPIPWDCYLIYYPKGVGIPPHQDKVDKGAHYRLNLILWKPVLGGEFKCEKSIFSSNRIKLFRPDQELHSVTPIEQGNRWVLSLGWVLRAKNEKPAS